MDFVIQMSQRDKKEDVLFGLVETTTIIKSASDLVFPKATFKSKSMNFWFGDEDAGLMLFPLPRFYFLCNIIKNKRVG